MQQVVEQIIKTLTTEHGVDAATAKQLALAGLAAVCDAVGHPELADGVDAMAARQAEPRIFKNKHFTKRDYERTNKVYCVAAEAPNANWVATDDTEIDIELQGMTQLYIEGGVKYFGWL